MKNNGIIRRSPDAQMKAMRERWPDFQGTKESDGALRLVGPLRPKAQTYIVSVFWKAAALPLPYVVIENPPIRPRPGASYKDIPHLVFNGDNPERSGLCLFDPENKEWSEANLIADTTIPWTAEWLAYYELWHLTGEWLAPGVGPESVGHMTADQDQFIRDLADVHRSQS